MEHRLSDQRDQNRSPAPGGAPPPAPAPAMPRNDQLTTRTYMLVGVLLLISYGVMLFAPQVVPGSHPWIVMLFCSTVLTVWFAYFLVRQRRAKYPPEIFVFVRPTHFVQALAQTSIFVYAGFYWDGVAQWAPFVLYQLVFAFVLDFLISVFRQNRYRLGFSVFPIVMSINLFIWFKPEYFAGQIAMIVVGLLAKNYLVRAIDGRPVHHIFNPSAFPMAVTAVFLVIMLNGERFLDTNNVVTAYLIPPHFQLFVFIVGLGSHLPAGVSFISLSALSTLFVYDRAFIALTGLPAMGDIAQPSVFLGLTLLVTDPMTSPRTRVGQLFYGFFYAIGIIVFYILLNHFGYPRYYDKLLPVPILNFLAPYIDRIRIPLAGWMKQPIWQRTWVPAIVYAAIFLPMEPTLERAWLRRSWFIENDSPRVVNPARRERLDPEVGALVQQRIAQRCQDDPTLDACRLLRLRPRPT